MIDNLVFAIKTQDDLHYEILIDRLDRKDNSYFQWDVVLDTIEHLLPHMAGSNISYLADGLFNYT